MSANAPGVNPALVPLLPKISDARLSRRSVFAALSATPEKTRTQAPPRGSFIDFVAAKQREVSQKVSAKQK